MNIADLKCPAEDCRSHEVVVHYHGGQIIDAFCPDCGANFMDELNKKRPRDLEVMGRLAWVAIGFCIGIILFSGDKKLQEQNDLAWKINSRLNELYQRCKGWDK